MRSFHPFDGSVKPGPRSSALALGALLALLAAGCGSSTPPDTSTQQASSNPGAAAFKFAECMRANGVTNFPDPQVTTTAGSGSISQALPASAVASPRFKSAQKACGRLAPAPGNARPDGNQPPAHALLAFAHCLRGHGFADFPDPDRNGRLSLQTISAAGVDYHSPGFLTAGKDCVGATHGAITVAEVQALVNGPH